MESSSMPMVSVVICFYNPPADYFREAIESVRDQTYDRWELFVVDNGTSNGSENVATEYAASFSNIHYLAHPNLENKGPAASRNLGMRQAQGELIAFLDADDLWLPDHLAEQVAALMANPRAAFSFGGILRWFNGEAGRADEAEVHTDRLEVLLPGEIIHRFLRNECIPGMSALVVRNDRAQAIGCFEESLLWAEDQTISYKLGLQHECLILPGWKVKYRQHPASTTTGVIADGRLFADHLRFLDWVIAYFKKANVQDASLWRELRRLHRQYRWLVLKQKLMPDFVRKILRPQITGILPAA